MSTAIAWLSGRSCVCQSEANIMERGFGSESDEKQCRDDLTRPCAQSRVRDAVNPTLNHPIMLPLFQRRTSAGEKLGIGSQL